MKNDISGFLIINSERVVNKLLFESEDAIESGSEASQGDDENTDHRQKNDDSKPNEHRRSDR